MDVQTPETPGRLSLRLDVYSPSQVLQIDGRLCHLVLASLIAGEVTNSRAPSLRGHCSASSLLRTHPPPSRRRSTSRLSRLYDLPCSGDFSPGRGGFLQLLGMSLSPCCRFPPRRDQSAASVRFRHPMLPSPFVWGLGSRIHLVSRPLRVHSHYGPVTRDLPKGDLVDGLQSLGFPPPCHPSYGASDFCPGRFNPC